MIFMKNKVTGVSLDTGNAFVVRFTRNIKKFSLREKMIQLLNLLLLNK